MARAPEDQPDRDHRTQHDPAEDHDRGDDGQEQTDESGRRVAHRLAEKERDGGG